MEGENYTGGSALRIAIIVLVVGLVAAMAYGFHARSQSAKLAQQNLAVNATLQQTQGQIAALTAKLNDLTTAEQARQQQAAEAAAARQRHTTHSAAARHVRRDDPRWQKFQQQLAEQNQAIESTRQDLASAKDELSGSIARTHGELVVLERKGERNYYEFDLNKSKQFAQKGSVGISLRKANVKHQYADLELMVDDASLSKKHVNLLEPVTFFAAENGQPVQLVINQITKDHIHGYVAEPKYKASDLAAANSTDANAAAATTTATAAAAPAPRTRRKLELPKD